ncbi:MAG TPA: DUF4010 domain-containing protein [Burkholderiaceae bacterium]|nr:DUF4010 domain-containing protein [Burkholderiaceae bacterium]
MIFEATTLTGLGVAFGCGLLIGVERERSKGSGPTRAFVGVRSFALVSFMGGLAQTLSASMVLVAALLVLALSVISHWRDRSDDPGVTTELALFLAFLLGVNAIANPAISAGAAVVVASLLNLRGPLHHFVRVTLKSGELRDALILAGAALIVWPLLPDQENAWLLGANPRRMWGLVLVIMTMQGAAHIALRMAGPRMGLALTGLASGFVSSTATIATMGQRYRHEPALLGVTASAATLSNVATYILLLVVTLTIAPEHVGHLAPSLGSALLATLLISAWRLRTDADGATRRGQRIGHAFSIRQALAFAALLSGATGIVSYANAYLGATAAQAGAMLAALADVHAAASSILSLAASGTVQPPQLVPTFLLAVSANSVSKLLAAASGGKRFFLAVAPGLLLMLLAMWLPYLLSRY